MKRRPYSRKGAANGFRIAPSLLFAGLMSVGGQMTTALAQQEEGRPNIVIILADDMGFDDMGSFGGEIRTPNLDALAQDGVRFTQLLHTRELFPYTGYAAIGCRHPSERTGQHGRVDGAQPDGGAGLRRPSKRSSRHPAGAAQGAGYHTYMTGKWHMGKQPSQIPAARGFERDFSLLDGAGSYWDMTNFTAFSPQSVFTEDGRYLTDLPGGYYATKTYTDKMIEFIESNRGDGKPFFAYVAHQAPHDLRWRATFLLLPFSR